MAAYETEQMAMNGVELYCSNYDPNLSEKSIREMVELRKRENPEYSPIQEGSWNMKPGSISYALISLCIKDDPQQTAGELAVRLATEKKISFTSAAYVVWFLREKNRLYFYDNNYSIHLWTPRIFIGKTMNKKVRPSHNSTSYRLSLSAR